jgi:hypothetical protein
VAEEKTRRALSRGKQPDEHCRTVMAASAITLLLAPGQLRINLRVTNVGRRSPIVPATRTFSANRRADDQRADERATAAGWWKTCEALPR